jgi:hypothetical protein
LRQEQGRRRRDTKERTERREYRERGFEAPANQENKAAGGSGDSVGSASAGATDSVGAAECDELLKKATAPDCKDKPGMSAIVANTTNWTNGLSTAATRDAIIQACTAWMNAVNAACGSAGVATGSAGWDGKASSATPR